MKRYIALDIGDVRIGVARSDIMGIIASPLETINRKKVKSVKRIAEICKENDTNLIVVGIPKSLDGEEKRQAEKPVFFHLCKKVRFTARLSTLYLHGISEIWQPE